MGWTNQWRKKFGFFSGKISSLGKGPSQRRIKERGIVRPLYNNQAWEKSGWGWCLGGGVGSMK